LKIECFRIQFCKEEIYLEFAFIRVNYFLNLFYKSELLFELF